MWGIILFIFSIILILSKVMYEVQYEESFPKEFNELFLLFLPLAVGFAAFLIARISAVAVRGILLILAVAAPWIYTINMGFPPFQEFFKYTLHNLHGESFIPFFAALAFALVGSFVVRSFEDCVEDLNSIDTTGITLGFYDIADFERFEDEDHDSTGKVLQSPGEGHTDS